MSECRVCAAGQVQWCERGVVAPFCFDLCVMVAEKKRGDNVQRNKESVVWVWIRVWV